MSFCWQLLLIIVGIMISMPISNKLLGDKSEDTLGIGLELREHVFKIFTIGDGHFIWGYQIHYLTSPQSNNSDILQSRSRRIENLKFFQSGINAVGFMTWNFPRMHNFKATLGDFSALKRLWLAVILVGVVLLLICILEHDMRVLGHPQPRISLSSWVLHVHIMLFFFLHYTFTLLIFSKAHEK